LCILLIIVSLLSIEAKIAPWTPVDWRTLPKASPNDFIEVWYLVAPLLEEDYGNLFKDLHGFHGAIAFRNLHTNFSITINYDANDLMHSSLFPFIVQEADGSKQLQWDNGGGNFIYYGINVTYWDEYMDVVGVMSGDSYNQFIAGWNAQVNASKPYYNMFSIRHAWNGTEWVPGWTCFDFVEEAFNQLYALGAQFDNSKSLNRNYINIYSQTAPSNVTGAYYSDPTMHEVIVDFYELIEVKAASNMSIIELVLSLVELMEGNFYVRVDTDYWKVDLNIPFFALDWLPFALPGQGSTPAPPVIVAERSPQQVIKARLLN